MSECSRCDMINCVCYCEKCAKRPCGCTPPAPPEPVGEKKRTWYLSRVDENNGDIWYELHDITEADEAIEYQASFIKFMGLRAKNDADFYVQKLKERGDTVI